MPQRYFQATTFISRHTIFLGLFDYVNHECVAEYVAHVIYIYQHDEAPVKKQKFVTCICVILRIVTNN